MSVPVLRTPPPRKLSIGVAPLRALTLRAGGGLPGRSRRTSMLVICDNSCRFVLPPGGMNLASPPCGAGLVPAWTGLRPMPMQRQANTVRQPAPAVHRGEPRLFERQCPLTIPLPAGAVPARAVDERGQFSPASVSSACSG